MGVVGFNNHEYVRARMQYACCLHCSSVQCIHILRKLHRVRLSDVRRIRLEDNGRCPNTYGTGVMRCRGANILT
jgi:hypothetical protein